MTSWLLVLAALAAGVAVWITLTPDAPDPARFEEFEG